MKGLIWKEFRQNWIWAVVGFFVLYLMMNNNFLLTHPYFESYRIVQFIMPVAVILGFVLGVLQVFREKSRDRWAFLMHRPLSAQQIVMCKVIAGISLLSLIWLAVIFIGVIQLATKELFSYPMYWFRPVPMLVALLISVPAYLSGILFLVMQPRLWIARILVLGPVIYALSLNAEFLNFLGWNYLWVAVIAYLVWSGLLLALLANEFHFYAENTKTNFSIRFISHVSVAAGMILLSTILYAVKLERIVPMLMGAKAHQVPKFQNEIDITKDGSLYHVKYRLEKVDDVEDYLFDQIQSIDAPDNLEFSKSLPQKNLAWIHLKNSPQLATVFRSETLFFEGGNKVYSRYFGGHEGPIRYGGIQHYHPKGEQYVLVMSKHEGILYAYQLSPDKRSYTLKFLIGKNGVSKPTDPKPESFGKIVTYHQGKDFLKVPEEGTPFGAFQEVEHSSVLLVCSNAIYQVNANQKAVKQIYTAPEGQPISEVGHFPDAENPLYIIGHPDSFRILSAKKEYAGKVDVEDDPQKRQVDTFQYLPGKELGVVSRTNELSGIRLGKHFSFILSRDSWNDSENLLQGWLPLYGRVYEPGETFFSVYHLTENNSLLFRKRLPLTDRFIEVSYDGKILSNRKVDRKDFPSVASYEPATFGRKLGTLNYPPVFFAGFAVHLATYEEGPARLYQLIQEDFVIFSIGIGSVLIAILLGQWYCSQKKMNAKLRWLCFTTTLLFGPAALIAFWLIENPERLELCEHCHKKMSIRDDVCPSCLASRSGPTANPKNIIASELSLVKINGLGSRDSLKLSVVYQD